QAQGAREAMIALPYLATGSSTQLSAYLATVSAQGAAKDAFSSSASPAERAAFNRGRRDMPSDPFRAAVGATPSAFPPVAITPAQYYAAWTDEQAVMTSAISAVQRVVDDGAAASESAALRAVLGYGLGVSSLVRLVLGLAWL